MKKILINAEERELRVAILEDDQLVELYIESLDDKSILNNIYKGRIEGIIPGLKAAFVNIGIERNAFLHFDDVRPDLLMAKAGIPYKSAGAAPELEESAADETDDYLEEPVAVSTAAAPGAAVPGTLVDAEDADEAELKRRRRRRGRRGGRRRREGEPGEDTEIDTLSDDESDEEGDEEEEQQPAQVPAPLQTTQQPQPSSSRRERRRDRERDRKRGRGDRDRGDRDRGDRDRGRPAPQAGNAAQVWSPAPGGAAGTREAHNPYKDVFSPYAQQQQGQGRKRWRKDQGQGGPVQGQSEDRWNRAQGSRPGRQGRDSQEDFFPPPPRPRPEQAHDEDELQPAHLRAGAPGQPPQGYDEEDEGPQPGNEKFGTYSQNRQGSGGGNAGAGKRRRRRGGRSRSMKKPGGSYYAVRNKKKTDETEASDSPAPKKTTRTRKAAPAEAKPEETPAKPKRTSRTKAAAEAPPVEAPMEEAKPKRAPRKTAAAEEAAPSKATPSKAAPSRTAPSKPASAKAAPEKAVPEKASPVKAAARGGKKTAAKSPDLLTPIEAPAAPVEEIPARKPAARRKKAAPAVPESAPERTPVAQVTAPAETAPPPPAEAERVVRAETTAAPAPSQRRARGGRSRAQAAAPAEETAPPVSVHETPPEPVEVPAPVSTEAPAAEAPRGRRRRGGRNRSGRGQAPSEAAVVQTTESQPVAEAPVHAESESMPPPPPARVVPVQPAQPPVHHGRERQRDKDRRPERRRYPLFTEVFKKGDELMVQVVKEEIGLKGARISTYVSLPGRYLVMLPYPNEEGGVSRKVEDQNERKRLKRILRDISANDEHAFIVRTAGIDRDEEEIAGDVEFLRSEYRNIATRYEKSKPGDIVYDDHNILYRLARDVFDDNIGEILVDSPQVAGQLREILGKLIPDLVDRVQVYDEPENIFHKFQVEKQIVKAARRKVWLKSGGYIIIDEAEALTAIDVNTGKFVGKDDQEKMILKTNLEAARTIARELKLRDIGGLIVVDFIDMKDQRNRDQLLTEFRQHLRKDRSKTAVSSVSEFGLVEMTRKRVRRSLRKTLFMDCPYCQGAGVILNEQQIWLHIKHELIRLLEGGQPSGSLSIIMNPRLRTYIDQNYRETLQRLEQKYHVQIRLAISDVFHMENYSIEKLPRETPAAESHAVSYRGGPDGSPPAGGGR